MLFEIIQRNYQNIPCNEIQNQYFSFSLKNEDIFPEARTCGLMLQDIAKQSINLRDNGYYWR
jgi:hypothetical protein